VGKGMEGKREQKGSREKRNERLRRAEGKRTWTDE